MITRILLPSILLALMPLDGACAQETAGSAKPSSSYLSPPRSAPDREKPSADETAPKTDAAKGAARSSSSYLSPPRAQTTADAPADAGDASTAAPAEAGEKQSPSYRVIIRDQVQMTVYGQDDLTVAQRVDGEGKIRIPLLGNVVVAGKTVRELEEELEAAFVEQEFLRSPMVTVRVVDYAPREITIFGAVKAPGTIVLPLEVNSIDIVEVVSKVGGFTPVAKSNQVRVIRNRGLPNETVEVVNVDTMITGQSRGRQEQVQIYPGDLIQVNQSLF